MGEPPPDGCPVGVTTAARTPVALDPPPLAHAAQLPSLSLLAEAYDKHSDGTVLLHGQKHRVTHPIASFGMETLARLRNKSGPGPSSRGRCHDS